MEKHSIRKGSVRRRSRSFSLIPADMMVRFLFLMILSGFAVLPHVGTAQENFVLRVTAFGGEKIADFSLRVGDTFSIRYIHSSDGTPVRDTFCVGKGGQLILLEEAYLWYGAGLEFQKHDGVEWSSDGRWSIIRLDRALPELRMRIGRVARQILVLPDRIIPFETWGQPGEGLIFTVSR